MFSYWCSSLAVKECVEKMKFPLCILLFCVLSAFCKEARNIWDVAPGSCARKPYEDIASSGELTVVSTCHKKKCDPGTYGAINASSIWVSDSCSGRFLMGEKEFFCSSSNGEKTVCEPIDSLIPDERFHLDSRPNDPRAEDMPRSGEEGEDRALHIRRGVFHLRDPGVSFWMRNFTVELMFKFFFCFLFGCFFLVVFGFVWHRVMG